MKISKAERLVCPFMSSPISVTTGNSETKCITDSCMAWKTTVESINGMKLDRKDCEGKCLRL